jgi:hypothetical protein
MEKKQMEVNDTVTGRIRQSQEKKKWHKPKLEDVSGKVMAQPYIRFT